MAEYWGFLPDEGAALIQSYSNPDWERVAPIAKALHDMGYAVWYDYGLIAGTQGWSTQISKKIKESKALVVYITASMFNREACFVTNEYYQAKGAGKIIIPVFLDDVDIKETDTQYWSFYVDCQTLQGVKAKNKSPEAVAKNISRIFDVYAYPVPQRTVSTKKSQKDIKIFHDEESKTNGNASNTSRNSQMDHTNRYYSESGESDESDELRTVDKGAIVFIVVICIIVLWVLISGMNNFFGDCVGCI